MEFVQKISQQLVDPGDQTGSSKDYVVLGESYPAITGHQDKEVSSGFLNGFFSRPDSQNTQFISDVHSRLHFTYRTKFVPIPRVSDGPSPLSFHFLIRENPLTTIENAIYNPDCFNTDIGWGCMIRTGQSLLGNALQIANLGRDFRVNQGKDQEEYKIIDWFADTPQAHFSIHNFVSQGLKLSNKKPGEWFGPAATSRSIQCLVEQFPDCGIDKCLISVSSGDVFEDEVREIFAQKPQSRILLLLGVKLGVNAVNEYYWDDVKKTLGSKFSVGIAGGRPSSSLYFMGFQGNELIYFDPHTPQPSLQTSANFYDTCHALNFGKLLLSDLDPSMLIGILISGEEAWLQWKEEVKDSKIFNVSQKSLCELDIECDEDIESVDSPPPNDRCSPMDGDYVDIKAVVQHTGAYTGERDEDYQDVHCKKQQIMVMGDRSFSYNSCDFEVEKILVEQETVGVANPNESL